MKYLLTLMLVITYHSSKEAEIAVEYTPVIYLDEVIVSVSKNSIVNDTAILEPEFRRTVALFLEDCKKQGIDIYVVETWRTPERQNVLKKKGRSTLSGGRSKHQHCQAIDIVPIVDGRMSWYNKKLWMKIGKIGEKRGLLWGGRWRRLYDPGHFEHIETTI